MIRALEVYDSFDPDRLLEVKFVLSSGEENRHLDCNVSDHEVKPSNGKFEPRAKEGYAPTGRTFRSRYYSLRQLQMRDDEMSERTGQIYKFK